MKNILYLYLIIVPFTNLFAPSEIISLPLLLALLIAAISILSINIKYTKINIVVIFVFLFLVLVFLSFIINLSFYKSLKPFNHLAAYFFTFLIFYLAIRNFIFSYKIDFEKIIKFITVGLVLTSTFTIIEFICKNFFFKDFDDYFFRPSVVDYTPSNGIDFLVIRARSTVEESGHYALYLISFSPICFKYLFSNKIRYRLILCLIIIISFLLTFSVGGIISLFGGFILLLFSSSKRLNFLKFAIPICIFLLALNYFMSFLFDLSIIENVILKLFDSGSSTERMDRFNSIFVLLDKYNLINYVFGFGPAAYDTLKVDPFLNLYLVFFVEVGLVASLIFISFIIYIISKWFIFPTEYTILLKLCLFSVLIQYNSIHNYFYPWLWLLLILIELNYRNSFLKPLTK